MALWILTSQSDGTDRRKDHHSLNCSSLQWKSGENNHLLIFIVTTEAMIIMKTIPFLISKIFGMAWPMLVMMMKMITTTNIMMMIKMMAAMIIKIMAAMIILKTISPPGSRSGGQIATWQGKAPLTMPATKQPDVSLPLFCVFAFLYFFVCVFFKQTNKITWCNKVFLRLQCPQQNNQMNHSFCLLLLCFVFF